jgi:hypothetical protein
MDQSLMLANSTAFIFHQPSAVQCGSNLISKFCLAICASCKLLLPFEIPGKITCKACISAGALLYHHIRTYRFTTFLFNKSK